MSIPRSREECTSVGVRGCMTHPGRRYRKRNFVSPQMDGSCADVPERFMRLLHDKLPGRMGKTSRGACVSDPYGVTSE